MSEYTPCEYNRCNREATQRGTVYGTLVAVCAVHAMQRDFVFVDTIRKLKEKQ